MSKSPKVEYQVEYLPASEGNAKTLAARGDTRSLSPAYTRRYSLRTLRGVANELASVYREARRGTLDTAEASRLAYLLGGLGKLLQAAELEARITRLEGRSDAEES